MAIGFHWCRSEEPEATRNLSLGLRFLTEPVLSAAEGFEMTIMELGNGVVPSPSGRRACPELSRRVRIAVKSRLPAMYFRSLFVESGGLMTYGPRRTDSFRRAATYVDKILKGAKPADLPVEQPTKFELVINLKTAKQIGLTIPPNLLLRADKVIK